MASDDVKARPRRSVRRPPSRAPLGSSGAPPPVRSVLSTRPEPATRRRSTRDRLVEAALDATEQEAYSDLSLRELTRRVGIVPTGFYRHFPDMDTLGLTIVDEAFGTLQGMIRSVREDPIPPADMIRGSVDVLAQHVRDRPSHFRFIVREHNGGSPLLREVIRNRLAAFTEELATDLGALPVVGEWREHDRLMLADLVVTIAVTAAAELLEFPDEHDALIHRTEQQLRLVVLAAPHWNP